MTEKRDLKEVLKGRILAEARQNPIMPERQRKPNKRLEGLASWLIHGQRQATGNLSALAASGKTISGTPMDVADPRGRMLSAPLDARWAGVLARTANRPGSGMNAEVLPWSRRIVHASLSRLYNSLAEAMGAPNALVHRIKDVNVGRLFDMAQSQDLGFRMKVGGESFRIDNPSELAVFMNHLLAESNTRDVARRIFSSPQTIESLRRFPEDHRLSTLLRVADQFDVEMTAYDRRPKMADQPTMR